MSLMPIVVVIIIVVVVLYVFISGNGIKFSLFKKKEHKVKAEKSNEEKYKDVLPKEDKKSEKKENKTKFASAVKKEKLKEDIKKEIATEISDPNKSEKGATGGGTVSKITKEDFLKNNISVPTTSNLFAGDDKKNVSGVVLPKAKEQPSKPYDFGITDNDDYLSNLNELDSSFLDDENDPFAGIDLDALLKDDGDDDFKLDDTLKNHSQFDGDDFDTKFNQKPSGEYFSQNPVFNTEGYGDQKFTNKTLGERFEEVFGDKYREMGGTEQGKEIIIGDILSAPRSQVNRAKRIEREKRSKWI